MKRYDWNYDEMYETETGEYVKYKDAEKLYSEVRRLRDALTRAWGSLCDVTIETEKEAQAAGDALHHYKKDTNK